MSGSGVLSSGYIMKMSIRMQIIFVINVYRLDDATEERVILAPG